MKRYLPKPACSARIVTAGLALSLGQAIHAAPLLAFPVTVAAHQDGAVNGTVQETAATGTLDITVVILDELTPKPVPLTDFTVTGPGSQGQQEPQIKTFRTDEKGRFTATLAPGEYTIESKRPVPFKGKAHTWKHSVTIKAGETATVQLTDADAIAAAVEGSAPPRNTGRQISDEAKIYEAAKSGVLTVESESGHGSGFLIDSSGLVLTNSHVVEGSHWIGVRFERGRRFVATVVAQDKEADVAVVRFNPAVASDLTVLKLADAQSGPVAVVGEKVLAIGSPLHQEKILTTGIVSKVEDGVLISDVNINHGNSGGPLLNLAGEVIGINTFGDFTDQGGPGISGIVAISKALPVLAQAKQLAANAPLPSAERLPDVSPVPIPTSALAGATSKNHPLVSLKAPSNFSAFVYTPFTMAALDNAYHEELTKKRQARMKKRGANGVKDSDDAGAPNVNPFWRKYAMDFQDAFVMVEIRPSLRESSRSKWRGFFSAVLTGQQTRKEMEYRDDFYDMELYRGGVRIEPVRRNRVKLSEMFDNYFYEIHDTAMGGMYFYDPSVFEPGQPITIRMRRESNISKWDEIKLGEKEQQRLWNEFASHRAALAAARTNATPADATGKPANASADDSKTAAAQGAEGIRP